MIPTISVDYDSVKRYGVVEALKNVITADYDSISIVEKDDDHMNFVYNQFAEKQKEHGKRTVLYDPWNGCVVEFLYKKYENSTGEWVIYNTHTDAIRVCHNNYILMAKDLYREMMTDSSRDLYGEIKNNLSPFLSMVVEAVHNKVVSDLSNHIEKGLQT